MKGGKIILFVLLCTLTHILLVGCVPSKYVPKPNEELYGTWINEKMSAQKYINATGRWAEYLKSSDSSSHKEFAAEIVSKWTDSEGNIWYKTTRNDISGPYAGFKTTALSKLSKNGTVWESVWTEPENEAEVTNPTYPTKIDPNDPKYTVYYREGK
jgi:hypothetical protein